MTGSVCSATAAFAVCQPTPNSAAAEAIERSSTLTRSARRLRARSVSAARGAICSQRSDHVVTAQSPSGHRQRRLAHTNTVGRPEIAKSRTAVRDRPCPIARVPHSAQPTTSAVVSTYSHHSPSISSCAPTTNPGMPTSAVAPWLPCITVKGLSFCRCRNPQNREALGRAGGPYEPGPNLTRPHTSSRRACFAVLLARPLAGPQVDAELAQALLVRGESLRLEQLDQVLLAGLTEREPIERTVTAHALRPLDLLAERVVRHPTPHLRGTREDPRRPEVVRVRRTVLPGCFERGSPRIWIGRAQRVRPVRGGHVLADGVATEPVDPSLALLEVNHVGRLVPVNQRV